MISKSSLISLFILISELYADDCSIPETTPFSPVKGCEKYSDCADPNLKSYQVTSFCDPTTKKCCKGNKPTINETFASWQCYDGATPLFNEKECSEYDPSKIDSGKCTPFGGCKYGHCCQPYIKRFNVSYESPPAPYITNMACNPDDAVTEELPGAYCEPNNKTYVFAMKSEINMDKTCTFNKDCGAAHMTCAWIENGGKCVNNQLLHDLANIMGFLGFLRKYLIAILIGVAVSCLACSVCIGLCIYCCCCRRRNQPAVAQAQEAQEPMIQEGASNKDAPY